MWSGRAKSPATGASRAARTFQATWPSGLLKGATHTQREEEHRLITHSPPKSRPPPPTTCLHTHLGSRGAGGWSGGGSALCGGKVLSLLSSSLTRLRRPFPSLPDRPRSRSAAGAQGWGLSQGGGGAEEPRAINHRRCNYPGRSSSPCPWEIPSFPALSAPRRLHQPRCPLLPAPCQLGAGCRVVGAGGEGSPPSPTGQGTAGASPLRGAAGPRGDGCPSSSHTPGDDPTSPMRRPRPRGEPPARPRGAAPGAMRRSEREPGGAAPWHLGFAISQRELSLQGEEPRAPGRVGLKSPRPGPRRGVGPGWGVGCCPHGQGRPGPRRWGEGGLQRGVLFSGVSGPRGSLGTDRRPAEPGGHRCPQPSCGLHTLTDSAHQPPSLAKF